MKPAEAIGKRVKELLLEKKMSQYRLTKITCLNEKTVTDLLRGRTIDSKFSTIYLIAEALGVTLPEFFNSPIFDKENIDV